MTRMHQAVEYEMKTVAAPEKAMEKRRSDRVSGGLEATATKDDES